jgi:MFS family permease
MMRFRGTFKSLKIRNYRLYFDGQALSMTGTWMQRVGTAWLVLELTGSGTLLGVTMALQELPTLLIGPWGGLLADRRDKRQLLLWTQSVAGLLALALAVLVSTGLIEVWMVMALAFAYGITSALAWPARQSFVPELVGPQLLTNAILLNSVTTNVAKAVGPALAGILIATVGLATTFYANAVSYVAVVLALVFMRRAELLSSAPARRVRGQLREGLVYVRSNPLLLGVLMLMSVSGMLAYEWTVTLPLFARDAFGGDADTFGIMFSAMGCGAVLGGTLAASGRPPTAQLPTGRGRRLQHPCARSRLFPVAPTRHRRFDRLGSGQHDLPVASDDPAAVAFCPRDAGPGDGFARNGVDRDDDGRRAIGRMDSGGQQSPLRPGARRSRYIECCASGLRAAS